MRQHRALGTARRPRGVEDRREIVWRARMIVEEGCARERGVGERSVSGRIERLDPRAVGHRREIRQGVAPGWIDDEHTRQGVRDEVVEFDAGIGGVQRQVDGAGFDAAAIERQSRDALLDLHRHPIAGDHPEADERIGEAGGAIGKTAIGGYLAVERLDEGAVSVQGAEQARDEMVRHASSPAATQRALARLSSLGEAKSSFGPSWTQAVVVEIRPSARSSSTASGLPAGGPAALS